MTHEPLSPRNGEIARLRGLARRRRDRDASGTFIVEGTKLVAEALRSDLRVDGVWFDAAQGVPEAVVAVLEAGDDPTVHAARPEAIERIATTVTPQPVVAEVELPDLTTLGTCPTAVLVGVDINDPGNVGTLMRSALAWGFDGFLAVGETADPFGPKTVRASAGAVLRLPVAVERDAAAAVSTLRSAGLRLVGTAIESALAIDEVDLTAAVAIMMGSEAHGLTGPCADAVEQWVAIPMQGQVESLNVAMAATVCAWEVRRQRGKNGTG